LGTSPLFASAGTSAAAFLDIPVGAGPAAMGSAYSALAIDAYAPTWNPAGLGELDAISFAGQHLAYIDTTHYEYASFSYPLQRTTLCTTAWWCGGSAIGGSIQYFGSGDITGLDYNAQPTGNFSTHFAAYNLAYGRTFFDKWSLGLTGKLVNAQLADVSANAFAMDLGSYYKLRENVQLAATLMNMGGSLTYLNEGDPLPLAFHLGGAYQPMPNWNLSAEVVYPRTGLTSFRMGTEWLPVDMVALRLGYRTDTLSGLSPLAGFSAGLGVNVWGQELSYAWVPYGDLGDTNYISLVMRFGEGREKRRNLIQYRHPPEHPTIRGVQPGAVPEGEPDYDQLMDLLHAGEHPPK
jgi:hypothetical protein